MAFRPNTFEEVAAWLRSGNAAVFPTDTVYGVGVSVLHAESPNALYRLKRRELGKPIAWLVGDVGDLHRYGGDVPEYAYELARQHWPGACTLIVRASAEVPAAFVPESGTIGLRMPANETALALIREVGGPLATSSANLSGAADTGDFESLDESLLASAGCALSDGLPKSGLASTVVDCTGLHPVIRRQGSVTIGGGVKFSSDELGSAGCGKASEFSSACEFNDKQTDVLKEPISFASSDGVSTISGCLWLPADGASPRAVVQLVHGMTEYVGRYDEFARYLVARGFAVCGADHVGHGCSVSDEEKLGHLPANGKNVLVEDVRQLHERMAMRFPDVPYVLFGHSMGSFIARLYAARYGDRLAAAVFCGTAQQPLAVSKAGGILARLLGRLHGSEHRSAFVNDMGVGAYSKAIPNARTPFDWLSTDEKVVDAYVADPLCGVMFSVGGYAALLDMTYEIATRSHARSMPKQLPILFVAGALDPVGSNGRGVRQAAEQLRRAGVEMVDLRLYEDMRHEILNEPDKRQVFEDVAEWIGRQLERMTGDCSCSCDALVQISQDGDSE